MSQRDSVERTGGTHDVTVDLSAAAVAPRKDGQPPQLYLGYDQRQQLENETNRILRGRLRMASLVLSGGFLLFLLWHFVNFWTSPGFATWLLIVHCLLTLVLGCCAVALCLPRPFSQRALRGIELAVFAMPAFFLLCWDWVYMREAPLQHELPYNDGMWLILLYTYALFIPNTWQRASILIGGFAAMPLVLLTVLGLTDPAFADALTVSYFTQWLLKMLVGAVTGIVAVYTIGTLRREVFEARQLGQYRLRERIGSGGMGEVYLAEHQLMKRPCAIKMIRPEKAGDPANLARFEREVQTTAKLSHWNNIDIFDYGRAEDGTFYYVMEFLPGMDLKQLVEEFGPPPAGRVIYLLRQICDALGEAHGIGLIHRDIKPGNIIACHRGGLFDVAKLLDFGLAELQAKFDPTGDEQDRRISGSPLYMSPEQVNNRTVPDERSDIYALGAVAYYLLTGRPPFEDLNPLRVMMMHVNEAVVPPSQIDPSIPPDLEEVVLRCLAKEPDDRYQTAAELREALDACAAATRWTGGDAAAWWQRNKHVEEFDEFRAPAAV